MDELITVLISSSFSIVLALVSSFLYNRRVKADLQKEYESRFNERKWETYTEFAQLVSQVLQGIKFPNKKVKQDNLVRKLYDVTGDLWIVGSDKVIENFNRWRLNSQGLEAGNISTKESIETLTDLTQIIIEMRRDLGYKSDKTDAVDLLRTFVNDIELHIDTS